MAWEWDGRQPLLHRWPHTAHRATPDPDPDLTCDTAPKTTLEIM
jgi:hypothetical protein